MIINNDEIRPDSTDKANKGTVKLPIDDYLELLEFKKKTLEGAIRVKSYHGTAIFYFSKEEAIKYLADELEEITLKIDENTKFTRSELEHRLEYLSWRKRWATRILDRIKGGEMMEENKPEHNKIPKTYIVQKQAVYFHGVFWVGQNLEKAKAAADDFAASDSDDYHEWHVKEFKEVPLNQALNDADHKTVYKTAKQKRVLEKLSRFGGIRYGQAVICPEGEAKVIMPPALGGTICTVELCANGIRHRYDISELSYKRL